MLGNNLPTSMTGFSLSYTCTSSSSCASSTSSAACCINCPSISSSALAGKLDSPLSCLSLSSTGMPKSLAISMSAIGAMTKSVGSSNSTTFQSIVAAVSVSVSVPVACPSGITVSSVHMGINGLCVDQSSSTICAANCDGTYPTFEKMY